MTVFSGKYQTIKNSIATNAAKLIKNTFKEGEKREKKLYSSVKKELRTAF